MDIPTISDVQAAMAQIQGVVHRTPVLTCQTLDRLTQASLFFKCENFQKVGAFKFRGAWNAVSLLTQAERARGVATHSSGNHAQALALAAALHQIPAYIVMPKNAPQVKIEAVRGYGAVITFCEPTLEAREAALDDVIQRTKATFIHPYNHARVIAGQGTAALELLLDQPNLDYLLAPVGGGGLLSGTALAAGGISPSPLVVGVEPEQADDAYQSWKAGRLIPVSHPVTIADGLCTSLGTITFPIIQQRVEQICTVSEGAIVTAMQWIWERMKIIVEPSAAVPLAAILEGKIAVHSKRVGIILSGGNVDLGHLPWK
ncbi:MAG: pyridoxal-phosphate dependent enzyme [bacterium]|jgi:threonine dehydratase|nr:pyridoxal-phosphate dependent enzyme [bacterium]